MSEAAPTVDADVGPFASELIAQVRAQDTYGYWEGKPDRDLLAPFIVDRQRARAIPIVGDPDPQTLTRISQFYNAVALSIERRSGVMASPVQQLSSEGFGRIVVIGGRLVRGLENDAGRASVRLRVARTARGGRRGAGRSGACRHRTLSGCGLGGLRGKSK
jgi:probable nitrogen fixation protein